MCVCARVRADSVLCHKAVLHANGGESCQRFDGGVGRRRRTDADTKTISMNWGDGFGSLSASGSDAKRERGRRGGRGNEESSKVVPCYASCLCLAGR